MADEIKTITSFHIDEIDYCIDAPLMDGKAAEEYQLKSNLVTAVDDGSTTSQYPSAKCLWTMLGDFESLLVDNNVITYTTTDGSTITPKSGALTGSVINIVSNTYSDGVGRIVYDGDIHGIGDEAFKGCDKLTSISFPGSVRYIGQNIFAECENLDTLNIVSSIYDIIDDSRLKLGNPINVDVYNMSNAHLDILEAQCPTNQIWYNSKKGVVSPNSSSSSVFGTSIESNEYSNGKYVITFSGNVTSIGSYAFRSLYGLTSIIMPISVTNIGTYAFNGCSDLVSVTMSNSVTSIGTYAFQSCYNLTTINMPNSIKSIGNYAFDGCYGLDYITIPKSVTSIGTNAFRNCSLISINVESGNTVYDSRNNCNALIETSNNQLICGCLNTVIPNSVTSIGAYAFNNCSNLESIVIPNSVTNIGNRGFANCSKLVSVEMSDSVTSIEQYAFNGCKLLSSIEIPNTITRISAYTFYGCSSLTSVVIPNSVTIIGDRGFTNCSKLVSVEMSDSVTSIGQYAFHGCKLLSSIEIPNTITSIGNYSFNACAALSTVLVWSTTPPTLGTSAFAGNASNRKIYVPDGSVDAYKGATNWSNYDSYICPMSQYYLTI